MPTTSSPRSSSWCASVEPMNPATPVTRTFIFCQSPMSRCGPHASRVLRYTLAQLGTLFPVAVRIRALPSPCIAAHVVEAVFRLPAKHLFGERWVGIALGHIPRTALDALEGDRSAARALECAHRLQHRNSAPGAQVHRDPPPLPQHGFHRCEMATRQIDDMNVVTYPSTVTRGIVAAEHPKPVANARGNLSDIRHQVVRNALRVFTDQSARVSTRGIEVPQQGNAPSAGIGSREILQNPLDHQFRAAVRVGGSELRVFADRHRGGIAVDRRRRGEHQHSDSRLHHRAAQRQRALHVVVVVFDRFLNRFAHRLESGEVDYGIESMSREYVPQRVRVAHVRLCELGRPAGDPGDAPDHRAMAVAQVVENDDLVPRLHQLDASVGSDVAGPARHQHLHGSELSFTLEIDSMDRSLADQTWLPKAQSQIVRNASTNGAPLRPPSRSIARGTIHEPFATSTLASTSIGDGRNGAFALA